MTDEAHDQIVRFTSDELAQLDKVEDVIRKAETVGDPTIAWGHIYGLRRGGELAARAIAKTLYAMKQRWDIFASDDDFLDAAASGTGFSIQTIRKGIEYWEFVLLPHPELMGLPVGALHLISPAAKAGDLDDEDWEALKTAPDKDAVHDIVRGRRGKKTSSEHALVILLERDGTLRARRGSEAYVNFGFLNLGIESEAGITAIDRICRAAGIVKR